MNMLPPPLHPAGSTSAAPAALGQPQPLDRLPRCGVESWHAMPVWVAREIMHGAACAGYDRERLLGGLGLTAENLADDQHPVCLTRFSLLMRRLAREMRDEFFGLGPQPVPLGSLSAVAERLLGCATLADALHVALRLYRKIHPAMPLRLRIEHGLAILEEHDRWPGGTFRYHCLQMYGAVSIARWLVGEMFPLAWAWMPTPARDPRWVLPEPFFGAPTTYGQPRMAVAFDARWLQRPVVQGRDTLPAFLRAAPGNLMRPHSERLSVIEQVKLQLRHRHPDATAPSLEAVASALGASPRSLRRRLQAEGLSYRHLKDAVRCDIAREWLTRSDLPVIDISDRLGFSDASTFHRAFKRWTGSAPGEFRRSRALGVSGPPLHAGREQVLPRPAR